MSSIEAEFTALCDAGKAILYIRSILSENGVDQNEAMTLFIDNNGTLLVGNAQQPTCQAQHMDIKHFPLLDLIECDLLIMKYINTSDNSVDALTEALARNFFYRYTKYILGQIIPSYTMAFAILD